MKNNAIMNGLQTFGTAIASGCKKHAGLLIATVNIASTCVLIYEVWTRKEKIQKAIDDTKDAPFKEKVKVVGKEMAPVIIPAAMSSGSAIAGAVVIKNAAKTVADMTVKTSEIVDVANNAIDAKDQYQKATKEVVGEEKEKEIREQVSKNEAAANPSSGLVPNARYDIYIDGTNPGIEFLFNEDKCDLLEKEINDRLSEKAKAGFDEDKDLNLTEIYDIIEDMVNHDIPETSVSGNLGWNAGDGDYIRISTSAALTKDKRPCMKIDYYPQPRFLGKKRYGYNY